MVALIRCLAVATPRPQPCERRSPNRCRRFLRDRALREFLADRWMWPARRACAKPQSRRLPSACGQLYTVSVLRPAPVQRRGRAVRLVGVLSASAAGFAVSGAASIGRGGIGSSVPTSWVRKMLPRRLPTCRILRLCGDVQPALPYPWHRRHVDASVWRGRERRNEA